MSRVFSVIFCFVVCFLVVYNVLVLCPSIRRDPSKAVALKYGTIIVTVVAAKLIFRPRPKAVLMQPQSPSIEGLQYVDPDRARRFEV